MRRIFISQKEKDFADQYLSDMKDEGRGNHQTPLMRLRAFNDYLENDGDKQKYSEYINNIIEHYDEIITLLPSKFQSYQDDYFSGLTEDELKVSMSYNNVVKEFYLWVVYCMRYDESRAKKLIQYIHLMGIKSCVYCNAQYATTFVRDDETFATYDLDHVWAKSKYPFLCTSFFNLVPSCPYCNKRKSDVDTTFNLYTEDQNDINPFQFTLDRDSKLKYYLSMHDDDLEIRMLASETGLQDEANEHKNRFHIDQIYSTHKDVVSELIWKSRIYNENYKKQLKDAFDTNVKFDFERIYKGYYTKPSDIHKRPLTKLMQDIGRELGL